MRSGAVVATAAAMLIAAPLAAAAAPRFTDPVSRTPVGPGQSVVVRGDGCPAGSKVVLAPRLFAVRTTTTAGPDGAFATSITMPAAPSGSGGIRSTVEISGSCGGEVIPGLILGGGPSRAALPFTGAPVTPLLAAGLVLVMAGSVTTVAAQRR